MKDITKEINKVLNRIRPYMQKDGGDCEFIKFENGIVYIRMLGACAGCGSLDETLKNFIEASLLEEVENVIGVENISE